MSMLHCIFFKRMILPKVTGQTFDLLKPKSYLSRWEDMQLNLTHYLLLPRFCQKLLNSYFPINFSLELQEYN